MLYAFAGIVVALLAAALMLAGWLAWVTRRIARDAERKVPPCGSFVTVGDDRIHYVERGEGPPILMIHGLGATLHHMRRPLMETFGDGYRLIAFDRPGSGYSTRVRDGEARLGEQARFVVRLIEALGIERPLLVGHSLGGAVALAVALDFPDRIAGLALLSPLTHVIEDPPEDVRGLAIRSPRLRRFLSRTIALPVAVRRSPRTLALIFGPQQPPADYRIEGGGLAGLRPSHYYAASTDFVAIDRDLARQQTRYGEIAMPVGIFYGVEDRVLDCRIQGMAMKDRIAGLDLEIVEGIGHMPQYAVTARVVAFIRRIADRAFAA